MTDLGSTNGTFLNGRKLPANEEHQIQLGDRLRIGSYEYVCKDHDEILNPEVVPDQDNFKFKPMMLLNFFEASVFERLTYVIALVIFEFLVFIILDVTLSFPPELYFLIDIATSFQIRTMAYVFVIFYGLSLVHAYSSRVYLKKSLGLRFFFLALMILVQACIFLVYFSFAITMKAPDYAEIRGIILQEQAYFLGKKGPPVSQKTRKKFEKKYIVFLNELPIDQQNILTKDYQYVLSKLDVPKVPTRQKRDEIPIDSSNEVGDPINQPISP